MKRPFPHFGDSNLCITTEIQSNLEHHSTRTLPRSQNEQNELIHVIESCVASITLLSFYAD